MSTYYHSNFTYRGNNVFFIMKEDKKTFIYSKQVFMNQIAFEFSIKKKDLMIFNRFKKQLLSRYTKSSIYYKRNKLNKSFVPYLILHEDDELLFQLENKKENI